MVFLTLVPLFCSAQPGTDDERLREIIRNRGQADIVIPYPGPAATRILSQNISIRSVRDRKVNIVLSPSTVEWFLSSGYEYSVSEDLSSKNIMNAKTMEQAMEWESYPTLPQYDSIMRYFAGSYPSSCRLDTIGMSIKGRAIYALRISPDAGTRKELPRVFLTSTMHGDEIGGFIMMLRLADYLLCNQDADNRIKNILYNLEIWINPLANPDGTYNFGDMITTPVRGNANGFDLNRNFPDPLVSNTVRQKETLDMERFMRKHRFALSANFHSGAEVINYPWDRWQRYHADNEWFYQISRKYADTVHLYSPSGYMTDLDNGITNGYAWYSIFGGRQDFVTYELNGREVTIEIDNEYITPADRLSDLWEYNRRSLLGYLENALFGIRGTTTDALTGEPVPAMLFIEGHDKDNSHVFSDTLSGNFSRLISPGTWDITFSAKGYLDTVLYNILVSDGQMTNVEVRMMQGNNPADTINPSVPLLYPNPGTSFIKAVLPETMEGSVSIRIVSQSGMSIACYEREFIKQVPLIIDISNLARGTYIIVFTSRVSGTTLSGRFIKSGQL